MHRWGEGGEAMSSDVSVRTIQAVFAGMYGVLAGIALLRAPSLSAMAVAVAMLVGAYLTGRVVPDLRIAQSDVLRTCAVGLLVLVAGFAAETLGGHAALGWATVVMAYGAGNRLKAAGIGVTDR
ncbi:hypothetical protein DBR17_16740 [Sphingomonas sp. HMWF008]|nr:hypothetical protein DBR17_16740 [Sphingomonas sp. HMWF008]